MVKRSLHRAQPPTVSCLACSWRQYSNKAFKELRKMNEEIPADYTGILVGNQNGNILLAQMQNGKQIGFVGFHMMQAEGLVQDIANQYDRMMADIMASAEAEAGEQELLEEPEDISELEDVTPEEGDIEGLEDDDPLSELRALVSEEDEE